MERLSFQEIPDLESFNNDIDVLPEWQIVVVHEVMERKDVRYRIGSNHSNKDYCSEKAQSLLLITLCEFLCFVRFTLHQILIF